MPHRVKVIVPIPMDAHGVANRRAQLPDHMLRPGDEVEFIAIKNSAALGDSYYDAALMDMFVIEAGLRVERDGFAAVCIDTVSDSGLYALARASRFLSSDPAKRHSTPPACWATNFLSLRCGIDGSQDSH